MFSLKHQEIQQRRNVSSLPKGLTVLLFIRRPDDIPNELYINKRESMKLNGMNIFIIITRMVSVWYHT